jgi:hypothetical protein
MARKRRQKIRTTVVRRKARRQTKHAGLFQIVRNIDF